MVFRNEGKDMVDNIYMATSNKALFKFDMKRFDFTVAAREEARIVLPIHIPLVPENIKSGKWRYVSKIIFLYRSTAEIFRTARVVIVFTVNKIVDVRGLACERLSKNLHMLTFSIHEAQKGYEKMLKSLHIRAGLDIKKVETAQFSDNIKYYIFARNNPDKTMEVYEFDRN